MNELVAAMGYDAQPVTNGAARPEGEAGEDRTSKRQQVLDELAAGALTAAEAARRLREL